MFCTNCGNKIELEEKFCTKCGSSITMPDNNESNSFVGHNKKTTQKSYLDFFWSKRMLIKNWLKKIILFLCVYFLSLTILNSLSNSYYDDNTLTALAPTILIVYIWGKVEKKFLR
jgi:uncharacterized membrane protein YvbJ